ncbi:uncharacterized protein A4U43_C09F14080, partial [Asparagus officinalis]
MNAPKTPCTPMKSVMYADTITPMTTMPRSISLMGSPSGVLSTSHFSTGFTKAMQTTKNPRLDRKMKRKGKPSTRRRYGDSTDLCVQELKISKDSSEHRKCGDRQSQSKIDVEGIVLLFFKEIVTKNVGSSQ